jgi:hypothetical protein
MSAICSTGVPPSKPVESSVPAESNASVFCLVGSAIGQGW